MKTRIKNASAKEQKPIEVTIAVTKFRGVLADGAAPGGRGTAYAMKIGNEDPRVMIKGDDIYIKRPGATLRFTIGSATGDRQWYYPVGVAFVREGALSSGDEQRLGLLNFPESMTRMDGRTFVITDTYKDYAPYVRYKFSVAIQRGSDGKIGIIDPEIIHEND